MSPISPSDIPVFILCGGLGTRLGDAARDRPKPMVEIGGEPILVHIMRCYERYGFRRFVLCAGHRADVLGSYFLNYNGITNDFTVDLKSQAVWYHQSAGSPNWEVTVAHTGTNVMTGARLSRAASRYLGDSEHFALTYGDGLTDADLAAELEFHVGHKRLGTVLAINPQSQYGRIELDKDDTAHFAEKPRMADHWVNGGFFFFRREFLDYVSPDPECVLEREPLARLASDGELRVFRHQGFWSSMDTTRDRDEMRALWETGAAPWRNGVSDAAD